MMEGMTMMGPIMWFFMLLFWGLVIFGFIYAGRWLFSRGRSETEDHPRESPLDILKDRYARGELSEEEYNRIKKDLE